MLAMVMMVVMMIKATCVPFVTSTYKGKSSNP